MMKRLALLTTVMAMGLLLQTSSIQLDNQVKAQAPKADDAKQKPDWSKKGRGYKPLTPERREHFKRLDRAKHGDRIQRAAKNLSLPAAFDARVRSPLPIWDQGPCGSCYLVSTVRTMTDAGVQAGLGKPDGSFMMAAQYGMDSPRDFGGCNGGNGTEVIAWAVSNGWIAEKWTDGTGAVHNDYPPYEAKPGRDRTAPGARKWVSGWTWGMVNNSGKPSVADIKAAMFLHGRLNVSLDAGGQFSDGTDTITQLGNSIDHEINMVAWDDAKDGGSFLLENQWSTSWGNNGVRWATYAAAANIVDHFWVSAGVIPPPPPPGPGPNPGALVITSPLTAMGAVGGAFSYQIVAQGATEFAAAGLPDGLTCAATTGLISGAPTFGGTFNVALSAGNTTATTLATLVLTVTAPTPPPPPTGTTLLIGPGGLPAGTYDIVPHGSLVITREEAGTISVDELLSRWAKCKAGVAVTPPAPQADLVTRKEFDTLMKAVIQLDKRVSPK